MTDPLGLPRMLSIPLDQQQGIADAVGVGEPPTPDEMEEAFGIRIDIGELIPPDVALQALLTLNTPEARALGVPGGGGVMRAADLALLYQAYLHDPEGMWKPDVLADATATVRNTLPDMWGVPANRTRGGLVVKGDDGLGPPPGLRPHRVGPVVRAQRRRRPARLRRPRERAQRRLHHQRARPEHGAGGSPGHRHRQPRRQPAPRLTPAGRSGAAPRQWAQPRIASTASAAASRSRRGSSKRLTSR